MSMLNLRWPLVAALGLGIGFPSPAGPPGDVAGLPRVTARLDDSFLLPDSVRALLTWVSDLVVDGEGSIYLSEARLPAILNLGPTGDFRRLIGRRGSGPGEFQSVYALRVLPRLSVGAGPGAGPPHLLPARRPRRFHYPVRDLCQQH